MCDILAISAGYNYTPQQYLPVFAEKGKQNMNGWGIGFFRNGEALVEKSSEQVFTGDQVHESFQRLARVIDSRIIVSHISCPLSGGRHTAHNHPFSLAFLGHIWLFVHVGKVSGIENYRSPNEPAVDGRVYPARIFEFLRDQLLSHLQSYPYGSIFKALRTAIRRLLSDYPGSYSFFLANESVLFAFSNYRELMLLRESETMGNVLLVTSVAEGLSAKQWLRIGVGGGSHGKLLAVAGPDILYLGDV